MSTNMIRSLCCDWRIPAVDVRGNGLQICIDEMGLHVGRFRLYTGLQNQIYLPQVRRRRSTIMLLGLVCA